MINKTAIVRERETLYIRVLKLRGFFSKYAEDPYEFSIRTKDLTLLEKQLQIMELYLKVLDARLEE